MSDMLEDQELTCSERTCGQTFIFTVGEQRFFAENNFSTPRRCRPCRDARKANKGAPGAAPTLAAPPPGQTFVYDDRGEGRGRGRGRGRGGRDEGDSGRDEGRRRR